MTNGSLMKVESIAECSFCNTFDVENQFLVFLRAVVLHRFCCKYLFYSLFQYFLARWHFVMLDWPLCIKMRITVLYTKFSFKEVYCRFFWSQITIIRSYSSADTLLLTEFATIYLMIDLTK